MVLCKSMGITHCVRSVQIRSYCGPNTGKYGPEKTPYLNNFYAVTVDLILYNIVQSTLQLLEKINGREQ